MAASCLRSIHLSLLVGNAMLRKVSFQKSCLTYISLSFYCLPMTRKSKTTATSLKQYLFIVLFFIVVFLNIQTISLLLPAVVIFLPVAVMLPSAFVKPLFVFVVE